MKKNYFYQVVVTVFVALFFFACNSNMNLPLISEEVEMKEFPEFVENETLVSSEKAIDIADVFFNRQKAGKVSTKSGLSLAKADVSVETVKDGNNPLMYIINNSDGGFVVVSATRSYYPILAYSDDNSFMTERNQELNGGILVWMDETKEAIKFSDALNDEVKAAISVMWRQYESEDLLSPNIQLRVGDPAAAMGQRMAQLYSLYGSADWTFVPLTNGPFEDNNTYNSVSALANNLGSPLEYTIVGVNYYHPKVGPLLATEWHQYPPYNGLCPPGCPAGCAAIAMAQIMKFHEFPTSYNWNNIPNTGATTNTQILIRDAGIAANTNYQTTSSSVSSIFDVLYAFRNPFYYTSVFSYHNTTEVKNEIFNNNRPVYMQGKDLNKSSGHAWVCDGVKAPLSGYLKYFVEYQINYGNGNYGYSNYGYTSASSPGNSNVYSGGPILYFHMNWGWDQSKKLYNGWFLENNVNLEGYNFQHNRENIFVHP